MPRPDICSVALTESVHDGFVAVVSGIYQTITDDDMPTWKTYSRNM